MWEPGESHPEWAERKPAKRLEVFAKVRLEKLWDRLDWGETTPSEHIRWSKFCSSDIESRRGEHSRRMRALKRV